MDYNEKRILIRGFLHFRTDIGDGIRSAVLFDACPGACRSYCSIGKLLKEHEFSEDTPEKTYCSLSELKNYLTEEKTWCSSKRLGINFSGGEPMREGDFVYELARHVKDLDMNLQIDTCGLCSRERLSTFRRVTDLFVFRLISPIPRLHRPFPRYSFDHVLDRLLYMDNEAYPYRIQIPVVANLNHHAAAAFACRIEYLKHCKSVILDFTHSNFSEEEILAYRYEFKRKGIPLY